jgi:predicted phosphodiesterase
MSVLLVISDIHANLEALQAVLDHAQQQHGNPDAVWCLGDLVGYGPDPGGCIDFLRGGHPLTSGRPVRIIKGNHDAGTISAGDPSYLYPDSADVLASWQWTFQTLNLEQRDFLHTLPQSLVPEEAPQPTLLVHAAPPDDMHKYLALPSDVEASINDLEQRFCFFGHTHLASYFECNPIQRESRPRRLLPDMTDPVVLNGKQSKYFINPGSVGQPRWGNIIPDPMGASSRYEGVTKASYLWVELTEEACTLWCHYVSYEVSVTIAKLSSLKTQSPSLDVPERWKNRLVSGLR